MPQPLGLIVSFGFGDRLGLAIPGHIAAVQVTGVAPIFAQQSVRENIRTGRSPQQVLDDTVWGIFEKISPADVLKDEELIDLFAQFDARQVMHVTFGSVLDFYGSQLKDILKAKSDLYHKYLKAHFDRHLEPFIKDKD